MDVLRPSLLPGLIHSLRHNVSQKNYDVALFEIGRVFPSAELSLTALQLKNAAWRLRSSVSVRLIFGVAASVTRSSAHLI